MARRERRGAASSPLSWGQPVAHRYEARWPSLLYVATAIFLAVGAFNSQNNLLYWAFSGAILGVLVSGFVSGSAMMGVRVKREPVGALSVGGTAVVRYRVYAGHRVFALFGALIREGARQGGVRVEPAAVAHCGPGEQVVALVRAEGVRRGVYRLGALSVSSAFPFGLVRKSMDFEQGESVVVLPAVVKVRSSLVRAAGAATVGTRSRPRRVGPGEEFYAVRDYVQGDAMRTIAWRRSASLDRLVVSQTAMPSPPSLWVEVDQSVRRAWSRDPLACERAISAAASLVAALLEEGKAVGLAVPWAGVRLAPSSGGATRRRMLNALAMLDLENPERETAAAPQGARVLVGVGVPAGSAAAAVDGGDLSAWVAPGAPVPAALLDEGSGR